MNIANEIHNWTSTKLIIGNGFDLFCGLKTSYIDYFNDFSIRKSCIQGWTQQFEKTIGLAMSFQPFSYWVDIPNTQNINVWDVLFTLLSIENQSNGLSWCDVETRIANSLKTAESKKDKRLLNFENIYCFLSKKYEKRKICRINDKYQYMLTCFVYAKHNYSLFDNKTEYYDFLLDELKMFEKDFGKYIEKIHEESNSKNTVPNFKNNSQKALEKICSINKLISVDTFNYDSPECDKISSVLHNINGDTSNPIFGIDSCFFESTDERYIFTKISRRMNQGLFRLERKLVNDFKNVIIFGCSLSEADFGYFFPILDKMEICNFEKDTKIAFAYCIYNQEKKDKIKRDLANGVAFLFEEYAKYKGYLKPGRLLDSLSVQGRVLFYQIKSL